MDKGNMYIAGHFRSTARFCFVVTPLFICMLIWSFYYEPSGMGYDYYTGVAFQERLLSYRWLYLSVAILAPTAGAFLLRKARKIESKR